jgi:SAM-dependent methyltransferase
MESIRTPFQGVRNIIRFNWQYYLLPPLAISLLPMLRPLVHENLQIYIYVICLLVALSIIISLGVSFYIYDVSGIYNFRFLEPWMQKGRTLNIHAGFDESSALLSQKFPGSEIHALDFYDPSRHTEISIKRARKAYPPFPGTVKINTDHIPFEDESASNILVIFSAHEIRDASERIRFFTELRRVSKPGGNIIVVEHLRNIPNFLAYNIGFFHFLSYSTWKRTFMKAGLSISGELRITPFIRTFILTKYGTAS